MKSIREIYKAGKGPSSSHTMGPERAARHRPGHPAGTDSPACGNCFFTNIGKATMDFFALKEGKQFGTLRVNPLTATSVFPEYQLRYGLPGHARNWHQPKPPLP